MQWIQCVGAEILAKKKLKIEDYCNDLSEMVTPIDQLGLLIIAHMYHQHFGVFLKDGVWSTRRDNSLENCTIYFAYNGGSAFSDTVDAPEEFLQEQLDIQSDTNVEVLDEHLLNLSAPPVAKHISPPPIIRLNSSSSDSDKPPKSPLLPNQQPAVHSGCESPLLPSGCKSPLLPNQEPAASPSKSTSWSDSDDEPLAKQAKQSRLHKKPPSRPRRPVTQSRGRIPKGKPVKKTKEQIALERKLKRELKKKERKNALNMKML